MMAGDHGAAMDVAKKQVDDGAHVIDINVDDGMLDGLAAMQKFVKIAVTEPDVARVPFHAGCFGVEILLDSSGARAMHRELDLLEGGRGVVYRASFFA
jgi:5-methyltetrahydrofolate--homocysteine methyltransferase